jgi:hypothetical protein
MKLFNATNSLLDLPWSGQRLSIAPRSFSQDFMGTPDFIQLITSTYNNEEIAIVVAGPYELSMCASVPVAVNYVVQSVDEAIQRFGLKEEKKVEEVKEEPKTPEPEPEPKPETIEPEEKKVEEVKEEKPETTKKTKKKKTTTKKKDEKK